jgi:hypothetical protein
MEQQNGDSGANDFAEDTEPTHNITLRLPVFEERPLTEVNGEVKAHHIILINSVTTNLNGELG